MALTGPCGATPRQVPAVAAFADEVFEVRHGWLASMYPTLFRADNAHWLRTLWDGDRPVSLVAVWRGEIETFCRRLKVARVGSVCTLPAYRGQGLAGTLLCDALARLQAAGTALVFISGRGPLYQRAGSRVFGDLREFFVDASVLPTGESSELQCVAPRAPETAILADMARLYEREPVHYVRSANDWHLLLPAKHYLPAQSGRGTVLVYSGGHAVAYALWDERGRENLLDINELAGDREALPYALGWMLGHTGRRRARFCVQPTDTALLRWAKAIGASLVAVPNGHSARVLSAYAFLDSLASAPGPGPDPEILRALVPHDRIGSPGEPAQAATFGQAALGPGTHALPLPRSDGPNYI